MKRIAVSLNAILLGTVIYLFATNPAPRKDEIFFVVLLFAAPLFSLVALLRKGGESWIGLYFKRKALEEKQKIANLGDKNH